MKRREAGQALVLAAVGLTVLMLAAGLAIDMGYLRYQKRRMQSAADSAAIAGAAELNDCNADLTCMTNAAVADAAANGFTNGQNGVTVAAPNCYVAINPPPLNPATCTTSVPYSSASTPYVQVTVSQSEPTFFMKVTGVNSVSVSAKAMAYLAAGSTCMYALGPGGISAGSGGAAAVNVQAGVCTVLSDGPLNFTLASHQLAARGIGDPTGNCEGSPCPSGVSPAPQQIVPTGDPLSFLQNELPGVGGGGGCTQSGGGVVCTPGDYPSGLTITGSVNSVSVTFGAGTASSPTPNLNVTFQPGTYTFGGNLTITGSGVINGMVSGSGVTFYTYGSASLAINNNADYTSCSSGAFYVGEQVQFSAPTSGQYAGVLYIQDPNDQTPASITLSNGDGFVCRPMGNATSNFVSATGATDTASYMWGAIYAHSPSYGTTLNADGIGASNAAATGCSNLPRFTEIVADTINLTNNINIDVSDCGTPAEVPAAQAIPDPIKAAVLVE